MYIKLYFNVYFYQFRQKCFMQVTIYSITTRANVFLRLTSIQLLRKENKLKPLSYIKSKKKYIHLKILKTCKFYNLKQPSPSYFHQSINLKTVSGNT